MKSELVLNRALQNQLVIMQSLGVLLSEVSGNSHEALLDDLVYARRNSKHLLYGNGY